MAPTTKTTSRALYCERLGQLLRRARTRLGLTQLAISANCGIPQTHLSRYEAGARMPTALVLDRLVRAYAITSAELSELTR